jgi:sporulation protein YlmC with PRC-barrel domain
LVALRAWLIHGKRDETRATSRFQQWDSLIAQALVWYGYADPMRGGDELREVDPVKEGKREVVRKWAMKFGDSTVTALDLQSNVEIRQAIADAREMREREVNTKIVGHYVTTIEGVRLDLDWRVIRQAKVKGEPARWYLEYTAEGEAPAVIEDDESDFGPGENGEDA